MKFKSAVLEKLLFPLHKQVYRQIQEKPELSPHVDGHNLL
jgi:hypothetical protein